MRLQNSPRGTTFSQGGRSLCKMVQKYWRRCRRGRGVSIEQLIPRQLNLTFTPNMSFGSCRYSDGRFHLEDDPERPILQVRRERKSQYE